MRFSYDRVIEHLYTNQQVLPYESFPLEKDLLINITFSTLITGDTNRD